MATNWHRAALLGTVMLQASLSFLSFWRNPTRMALKSLSDGSPAHLRQVCPSQLGRNSSAERRGILRGCPRSLPLLPPPQLRGSARAGPGPARFARPGRQVAAALRGRRRFLCCCPQRAAALTASLPPAPRGPSSVPGALSLQGPVPAAFPARRWPHAPTPLSRCHSSPGADSAAQPQDTPALCPSFRRSPLLAMPPPQVAPLPGTAFPSSHKRLKPQSHQHSSSIPHWACPLLNSVNYCLSPRLTRTTWAEPAQPQQDPACPRQDKAAAISYSQEQGSQASLNAQQSAH